MRLLCSPSVCGYLWFPWLPTVVVNTLLSSGEAGQAMVYLETNRQGMTGTLEDAKLKISVNVAAGCLDPALETVVCPVHAVTINQDVTTTPPSLLPPSSPPSSDPFRCYSPQISMRCTATSWIAVTMVSGKNSRYYSDHLLVMVCTICLVCLVITLFFFPLLLLTFIMSIYVTLDDLPLKSYSDPVVTNPLCCSQATPQPHSPQSE